MSSVTPEDLIVKNYDETLNDKEIIETKAANYMVAVTLIMSILAQYITGLKDYKICNDVKILCLLFCVISFALGLILLFLFIFALKTRQLKLFDIAELINLYKEDKKDSDKLQDIVDTCESFSKKNEIAVTELRKINKVIHIFVLSLVVSFVVSSICFFSIIIFSVR